MKLVASVAMAAMLAGTGNARQPTAADVQQLMEAAIQAGVSTESGPQTICVQRELEAPLDQSRAAAAQTHQSGLPGVPTTPARTETAVSRAFAAALRPTAAVAPQRVIRSIPAPYVAFSSRSRMPSQCAIGPIPPPGNSARTKFVSSLRFSRPVFANGFAFVDQVTQCPGLCGGGWLRIFRKQSGKWKQVAARNLWVS